MAGRNIRRRKAVGGQRRRKNIAGSQVLVSSEEQVFRVLVSKFLKGTLSTGDPEGTMFFFLGSWLKGLPDLDMTKNLATKERRDVNEVCVEPFEFVEQFRELLEDRRKESFEDAVAWLAQNFSSTDWKRAVQWCGVKRILGIFAGGRAPEKDDIEKTSQDYGLTPEETKVLGLGWLKDVVDLDKAHLGLEDQERRGVLTRKEVDDKLRGLGWIKPQPDTQWCWIAFLLGKENGAGIKSDIDIPAAKSRIWSTVATISFKDTTKRGAPWTWDDNKADIEDLKDEYRAWMIRRAIRCEVDRIRDRTQSGGPGELEVEYQWGGRSYTFSAKAGLFSRQKAESFAEKLREEVGTLLSPREIENLVCELLEWGDQNDLYRDLVFPAIVGTADWPDRKRLASSGIASYYPEDRRHALINVFAEVVQVATETKTTGKVLRAREIEHVLAGKAASPSEKLAANDYVAGEISKGVKDALMAGIVGSALARLGGKGSNLRKKLVAASSPGGGSGSRGVGSWHPRTPRSISKLGHGLQNLFEENPFWFSLLSVGLFLAWHTDLSLLQTAGLTIMSWKVLAQVSKSRLWWLGTLAVVVLMVVNLSAAVPGWSEGIIRLPWETGGSTVGEGVDFFSESNRPPLVD